MTLIEKQIKEKSYIGNRLWPKANITVITAALLLIFWMILGSSCEQIEFTNDPGVKLSFSADTIIFDTVFTTAGSATFAVKLYNESEDAVKVSEITIDNPNSFFRFNVDGLQGPMVEDLTIYGKDSVYLFCEVTIDPDQPSSISPFVIEDKIKLVTNDNLQEIFLVAWGQNAVYIPAKSNRNQLALLSCDLGNVAWDDPRPYVLYGVLLIDSCTVNIPPGARIYFHGALANNDIGIYQEGFLFTLPNGRLNVQGTRDNPVLFTGDRLEEAFANEPGQWPGIRMGPGSRGNVIRNAIIRNSVVGIRADSLSEVNLENVEIANTRSSGIVGVHADIKATNCLLYNNFQNGVQVVFGGTLDMEYCTVASYGNDGEAITMNNFFCYDPPLCNRVNINALEANLTNCIFAGNELDEVNLFNADEDPGMLQYTFDHCIVRVNDLIDEERFPDFFEHCSNCVELMNFDPVFANQSMSDYRLDSMSIAIGNARPISVTTDKTGKQRDGQNPDIGCLEF